MVGGPDGPSDGGAEAARSAPVEVGDVRDIDGVVEWRCRTCGSWVGLEQAACTVCGTARTGFGGDTSSTRDVRDLDGSRILGASLVLPGLGHVLAGRIGSGITRMLLALIWLIGGLWWLVATTTGRLPGVILVIGAVLLWVASAMDIRGLLAGGEEPFGVRGLLWFVVGVTALLMITVAVAATGSATV